MVVPDSYGDAILYGQVGARDAPIQEEEAFERADGTIEYLDGLGNIYKIYVPMEATYSVETPFPDQYPDRRGHVDVFACTVYVDADNRFHREDGPALIEDDGDKEWWNHGLRTRADGPAIERSDGSYEYWLDGKRHRDRDQDSKPGSSQDPAGPAVLGSDGSKEWWYRGELHRDRLPAVILPEGTREWWQMDVRHRDDGPAVILSVGGERWYWRGELCTHREWKRLRRQARRRGRRWMFR